MNALSGVFHLSLHFSNEFAQEAILQCYLMRYFAYDFYMFHKKEISVEQSYAILDYVKRKIAQDTKVGELVKISYEDFL